MHFFSTLMIGAILFPVLSGTVVTKVAAHLFRKTQLSWANAVAVALLMYAAEALLALLITYMYPRAAMWQLTSLAAMAVGTWYMRAKARSPSGSKLELGESAAVALIAMLLNMLIGFFIGVGFFTMLIVRGWR
jgi:hypothetical protein